jgi:acyl carrier protein
LTDNRRARIKEFLSPYFRNHELQDDEDIFALGFVNSLLALQLVNFVENEFGITIEDEDLDFENFRTIQNMDALIERKTADGGRSPTGAVN